MGLTFKKMVDDFISGASLGMSGGQANLKISGNKLFHYETTIAERYNEKFIVNFTRYSFVTGRLQKVLKDSIPSDLLIEVQKIPIGYNGSLIHNIEA